MRKYYLSQPVFSAPVGQLDRENGIIRGITISRVGIAKGHEGNIDLTFLQQIVDQASTRPQGIKARFGHPNMCATALGTYLGRFQNYALSGQSVTADLHLDETSKATPSGNLHDYILDMAEKNPDMFGASIVFEAAEFALSEEEIEGKKTKIKNFRLKELRATDIVDEPAATDGLFSADSMPAQATQFLDENPALAEFIFTKPANVIEFLTNYLNTSDMNLPAKLKSEFLKFFSLNNLPEPEPQPQPDPQILSADAVSQSEPNLPEAMEVNADNAGAVLQTVPTASALESSNPESSNPQIPEVAEVPSFAEVASFAEVPQSLSLSVPQVSEVALAEALADLQAAHQRIITLEAKLAAKPTVPLNVTDPQVSVSLAAEVKDETGKQMLKNLPADLKRKLKAHSQQTP